MRRWIRAGRSLALLLPLLLAAGAGAQDGPRLTAVAEFPLGDNCPIAGTLNADATAVWALMKNCSVGGDALLLQAFALADGSAVGQTAAPFPTNIAPLDVFSFNRPLTLGADGALLVDLVDDSTTMSSASFMVDPSTGAVTPVTDTPRVLTAGQIMAALPAFTGYTDMLTYSDDRSLALTQDDAALYVFNVASGQLILRLEPPGGVEYATPWFGPGSYHLYIAQMADPGNYDNPAETLYVFDIASGAQVAQYDSPHTVYAISPDERLAVVSTIPCCDHLSLAVLDLAAGTLSASLPTQTSTVTLDVCKNDGRATSFDWVSSDPLMVEILWLPDSSGFITLHSEVFSSGPTPCYANDSRMRVYAVAG